MASTDKALDELVQKITAFMEQMNNDLALAYPERSYPIAKPVHLYHTLKAMENVLSDYQDMRRDVFKALEILDALGIWTGADDLVHDRLVYLLSGMAGYCDPAKTDPIVKPILAKWKAGDK